jgi:hypothetical protein
MEKISAEHQSEIIGEVPRVLRALAAERDLYKQAFLEGANRARVEKVASMMLDKGIKSGNLAAVADEIEKEAAAGTLNLDVTEQAVELVGKDMGKLAHLSDAHSGAAESSDLERFLLGG